MHLLVLQNLSPSALYIESVSSNLMAAGEVYTIMPYKVLYFIKQAGAELCKAQLG